MSKKFSKNRTHIRPNVGLHLQTDIAVADDAWPVRCRALVVATVCISPLFVWAYGPTWRGLMETWNREADYSHGWLVFPLALFFLWLRRDRFPARRIGLSWAGLPVLGLSLVLRWLAARYFVEAIDGWSMILWLVGWFWLMGGYRLIRWMAPALGFLLFMIPLPYRLEGMLSVPLQQVATQFSCFLLQLLGQPAFAEGTTILLGDQPLQVEQACSGLRIFMGILALAVATLILSEREWWERTLLLFAVVPIALLANATRIVVTGLLYRHVSGEAARHFSHDMAGWLMILFAATLFMGALWYLSRLMPEVAYASSLRANRKDGQSLSPSSA